MIVSLLVVPCLILDICLLRISRNTVFMFSTSKRCVLMVEVTGFSKSSSGVTIT